MTTRKIVVQIYYDKEELLFFYLCRFDDAQTHSWIDCLFHSSENFNDVCIRDIYIFIGFQGNYFDSDSNPTYPDQMKELWVIEQTFLLRSVKYICFLLLVPSRWYLWEFNNTKIEHLMRPHHEQRHFKPSHICFVVGTYLYIYIYIYMNEIIWYKVSIRLDCYWSLSFIDIYLSRLGNNLCWMVSDPFYMVVYP